jgi:hypothetical protein
MGIMLAILGLWIIFYERMISSTRRLAQIVDVGDMDTEG